MNPTVTNTHCTAVGSLPTALGWELFRGVEPSEFSAPTERDRGDDALIAPPR
jgi:hypothetical protein